MVVVDRIVVLADIDIDDPAQTLSHQGAPDFQEGLMDRAIESEAMGAAEEILLMTDSSSISIAHCGTLSSKVGIDKDKMAKLFELSITDDSFTHQRRRRLGQQDLAVRRLRQGRRAGGGDLFLARDCKAGRPRPRGCICDVLTCIADRPINRIDELLPWN
jgi:hypothetical protein